MLNRAIEERKNRIKHVDNWDDFMKEVNAKNQCLTPWCDVEACEDKVKEKSKVQSQEAENAGEDILTGSAKTLCIPFDQEPLAEGQKCFACGEAAKVKALWGRSY